MSKETVRNIDYYCSRNVEVGLVVNISVPQNTLEQIGAQMIREGSYQNPQSSEWQVKLACVDGHQIYTVVSPSGETIKFNIYNRSKKVKPPNNLLIFGTLKALESKESNNNLRRVKEGGILIFESYQDRNRLLAAAIPDPNKGEFLYILYEDDFYNNVGTIPSSIAVVLGSGQ